MDNNVIIQAWIDYCASVLGNDWTITRAEEVTGRDAPRPVGNYLTLKVISGPGRITIDDELRYDTPRDAFNLVGQRSYTLSIQAFRAGNSDALNLLSSKLGDPDFYDQLKVDADISVTNKGSVTDISAQLETGFESRSAIDIFFNSSNNIETGIGTLEKVEISGELENPDGTKIAVEPPLIEKE